MTSSEYFILSVRNGEVTAVRASPDLTEWPVSLAVDGAEYLTLEDGDTFFFWDEIRNATGSTVGYMFLLPESPTFKSSLFIRGAKNVSLSGEEVTILLESCSEPVWECVQGFGSEIYVNESDESDCVVLMFDYSQNRRAFQLHESTEKRD